jgi:iron complex outermembrane receptor protein
MMKALTSVVSVVFCLTIVASTACRAAEAVEPTPASRSSPASASRIEEIVVTGEFRSSSLQETPASVSVVILENSRAGTVNHLEEILGWLPNVNFASGGSRARFFQVRGIGERGQFTEPLNSSVGLVVDGVDLSGIGSTATLFDVDQVEVLRGPQGTLYGANAIAGLINVRTADPTPEFTSRLRLDAGDYDTRGVGAVVSGPAGERIGYRLAAQLNREDGFIENDFLGRDDTNDKDELTVRGKLAWRPTDAQSWTFVLGHVDVDNGYDAFSLDNDRTTLSDQPGRDAQESDYGSASVQWDVSPAVVFQGSLGLAQSDTDYGYDEDWTYEGFPDGYSSTDRYLRERDAATLDLRFLSGPSGRLFGGTTGWVAGIYALHQTEDMERQYTFADADFESEFEIDRIAAYGELERGFAERFTLTFGLRAEQHRSEYRDSADVRFDPQDDLYGGRLVLSWRFADDAMAYASLSRGYKAGGFNISGTLDADLREYDPEALWNYEVGLKGLWFDGRLDTRVAVFAMQRDDVQVETSITHVRPDGSAEFVDLISNAAEGVNTGAEIETTWWVTDRLELFASVGLLDTEFEDFVNNNEEDLDGHPQAHAPSYQFHAGAEYRLAPGWFVRVESQGKDSFYYSNSERFVADRDEVRSEPYALWHASLGYETDRWSVKLWGRNLGDEDYTVRGYYFGNDPRDGYTPRGFFQLGEPRRYGVTLTLDY